MGGDAGNLLRLDFTRVIPGHGETTDRAGLRQFLAVIAQLAEVGRTAADGAGTSRPHWPPTS